MSNTKGRAYDTNFELHKGLIHTMAKKGFGRLMQTYVCIDYEDVFQEMCLTYVKAANKYDPEKGITFTAYLGRAIWNEFNKFAERETRYVGGMGLPSLEQMSSGLSDDFDILDIIDTDVETPESYIEARQERRNNMKLLTPVASFIVKQLLSPSDDMLKFVAAKRQGMVNKPNRDIDDVSIKAIVAYHKIPAAKARSAKRQLSQLYEVNV